MRRAITGVGVLLLLAGLSVAAPALSTQPYIPEPVEFAIPAPLKERPSSEGGPAFVSQAVRAPERFNLVGFTWNGHAEPSIAVRVRGEDEEWGEWTQVPAHTDGGPDPGSPEAGGQAGGGASAPVWSGQADLVQYRFSRRPADLRLEFLNTTGTAGPLEQVATAVRGAANEAVVALAGVFTADAATRQPGMVSRAGWGAEDCRPRRAPEYGQVKAAFVHHTVNANDYSRSEARAMVLGICRYHRNTLGWDDIGYQFLVDKYGTIYEGRAGGVDRAVIGAQTQGFNDQSTGIANLGTFDSRRQSSRGIRAVARVIRWKLPHHGRPTSGRTTLVSNGGEHNPYPEGQRVRMRRISGHRDGSRTECPGNALYRQMSRIRRLSDVVAPDRPRRLRARGGSRRIRLNWADNSERDLRGYRVYIARAGGGWRAVSDVGQSRFVHRKRRPGRTYTYRVKARDQAGNMSPASAPAAATARR